MSRVVLTLYRFACILKALRFPLLPALVNKLLIRIPFGCVLGLGARFGSGVCLAYGGLGTVIHHKAVIGNNVYIGAGVVIGGTNRNDQFPVIHDDCLISTGVKIIGPVTIGQGTVIGANAVVTKDIPGHCVAVGIPARIIKENICMNDYR